MEGEGLVSVGASLVPGEWDGWTIEQMEKRWQQLREEVMALDAQLASRNAQDPETGRRLSGFEYSRWRTRAVQRKQDNQLQMAQLKRLVRERKAELPQPENAWWRDRALNLRDYLRRVSELSEGQALALAMEGLARDDNERSERRKEAS